MPSPRSRFEFACRVGAFGALGLMLGFSLIVPVTRGVERSSETDLTNRLVAWTKAPPPVAVHGDFDATPDAWAIEWLAALRRSGRAVTWSGSPPPVAASADALPDPSGVVRIDVAAPRGSVVSLRDSAGVIDSLRIAGAGGSALVPLVVGALGAWTGHQHVGIATPPPPHVRSIVVVANAGWEGKFIATALEESGWRVAVRFSVAPSVEVTQGQPLELDTSRVAAVVAVDSSIQSYGAALDRYVHSGGGLILAGAASGALSVEPLAPATNGARVRPAVEPTDTIALGSTGFYPASSVRRDAVVLDRRPAGVAVVARRIGAGRVLYVGFDDSWRWRMAGGPGSERAHRAWWSRVVAAVAYAPTETAAPGPGDAAPLAHLVDALGPPHQISGARPPGTLVDTRIMIAFMLLCLLAEWASRRLRGLK